MVKSSILKVKKRNTHQKKAENNPHSDFQKKIQDFVMKKLKKEIDFVIFDPNKS